MGKMENTPKSTKAAQFIIELQSGKHALGMSRKPGKRERNRVFVNAAIAAGYTELTAGRWRRDIAPVVGGELACERAFLEGISEEKGGKSKANPPSPPYQGGKNQVSLAEIVPEGEQFDMSNPAHRGMAKLAGVFGTKAIKYFEIRTQYTSEYQAMLAAGFSEQQARHPERFMKAIGKLGGADVVAALEFYGVDNANIAELLAEILQTRRVVDKLVPTKDGGFEVTQTSVPDPACVSMALTHIEKLMFLAGPPVPGNTEENAETDKAEMKRLLVKNGLISA